MLLHRDPVELSASVCSLITTLSGTFTDADHRAYIADHWVEMLALSIDRIDAFRAAHPEFPIVDVQYDDLVREPGRDGRGDLRPTARRPPPGRRCRPTSPRTRKGSSARTATTSPTTGSTPASSRERFAGYIERYQVPVR